MNKFVFIAFSTMLSVAFAGHHHVVTPDILHRVADVLSHGYGEKIILGYPQKAHLVDYSHSVHSEPHYGHGYNHIGYGGHEGGHAGHIIGHHHGGYLGGGHIGHGGSHYHGAHIGHHSGHSGHRHHHPGHIHHARYIPRQQHYGGYH